MQAIIEKSKPTANAVRDIPESRAKDFGVSTNLVFTENNLPQVIDKGRMSW
jgi:hypothetical protein